MLVSERLGWSGWLGFALMLVGILLAEPAAARALRRGARRRYGVSA